MLQDFRSQSFLVRIGFIILIIIAMVGCSNLRSKRTGGLTTPTKSKEEKPPSPVYYDFGDVLVPHELKLDRKASFVFQTPEMTAGVLSLGGNVEVGSLIQFFETNMNKDNWRPVSSFKSVRTIMLFQKDNRWCVISISEKGFSTQVEIWVAPTTHQSGSGGLLK